MVAILPINSFILLSGTSSIEVQGRTKADLDKETIMYKLYNNDTGEVVGDISEGQLQFLKDQMEEESLEDQDYEIEPMTLAYFQELGIDTELLGILQRALGDKESIIIRWA